MTTFSKEFKEALSFLPAKEKDKLILRLLKKDLNLANRLRFELVETRSVEELRETVEKHVISTVDNMSNRFYSIGYLNMDVRYLSGDITQHVKITKDKYGEVSLNLLLLIEVLKKNKVHILGDHTFSKLRKFCVAIVARVFKVLLLINKMEDDLLLDFKEDLSVLGELIGANEVVMKIAIKNGLDVNWLIFGEIPHDIVSIHKELKANGYLK